MGDETTEAGATDFAQLEEAQSPRASAPRAVGNAEPAWTDGDGSEIVLEDDLETEEEKQAPARFAFRMPAASDDRPPRWVRIPKGLRFPKGRQAVFIRFKAEWTDVPWKGHALVDEKGTWRQCIAWALTDADEKMALGRAMSDANRAPGQLAKQMIRAVDGYQADWSGSPGEGSIDAWWTEIGGRCRTQLIRLYTQLHMLSEDEQKDFFETCIAVRSTG